MTDRPPRTAAQMFAARFGVSEAYAKQYVERFPDSDQWDSRDAELRAMAATADVDAVLGLNDVDLVDAAEADDPEAELSGMVMDASDRHLRAKLAAHTRWARTPEDQRREQTRKAREAFEARFEREVDPDGTLDPAERSRRAEHAKKAHYLRMALKSAQARRRKRDGGG